MKINKEFADLVFETRKRNLNKRASEKTIIHWTEKHRSREGITTAIVFILPTRGCSWALSRSGGCSICGYIYDNPSNPNLGEMITSFEKIIDEYFKAEDARFAIKIFTSGSVLDPRELPHEVLAKILNKLAKYDKKIVEIVLESRPEYVNDKNLQMISEILNMKKVEIAIGLESANDFYLRNSINKGFLWKDFVRAAKRVQKYKAKVKTYLLFKPPFLSELDAIIDIINSTKKVVELNIDTISINAISIHRGTYLSTLFEEGKYRPPWLWSLVYICKQLKDVHPNLRIICEPVSAGKERGAHNCGECDNKVADMLKEFTLTQDPHVLKLEGICSCINDWKLALIYEKLLLGEAVITTT